MCASSSPSNEPLSSTTRPFPSVLRAFLAQARLSTIDATTWFDLASSTLTSCLQHPPTVIESALDALKAHKTAVTNHPHFETARNHAAQVISNALHIRKSDGAPHDRDHGGNGGGAEVCVVLDKLRRTFDLQDAEEGPGRRRQMVRHGGESHRTVKRPVQTVETIDCDATTPPAPKRPRVRVHATPTRDESAIDVDASPQNTNDNIITPTPSPQHNDASTHYAFHLLATHRIPSEGNAHLSLQDIVPPAVDLAIVCNFMYDLPWLWDAAPALQTARRIMIVHGGSTQDEANFRHFLQLQGAMQRTRIIRPRTPAYGTVHTKMFVFCLRGGCRICVHTANMVEPDWKMKTQAAYMRDFPILENGDEVQNGRDGVENGCMRDGDFGGPLDDYFRRCLADDDDYNVVHNWLMRYDFSSAGAAIVASVPGVHKGPRLHTYGHMRLRHLLSGEFFAPSVRESVAVCQFSSLGSIQGKWLSDEFGVSLFTDASSTTGGGDARSGGGGADIGEIKLVLPTVEQVMSSNEGIEAGFSIPVYGRNLHREHIKERLHKWNGDVSGRQAAMPHIKTFLRYGRAMPHRPAWIFVGSFNLSVAAWGRLQGGGGGGGKRRGVGGVGATRGLNVLSYEMGVLFSAGRARAPVFGLPEAVVKYSVANKREGDGWKAARREGRVSLAVHDFGHGGGGRQRGLATAFGSERVVRLPLPYALPPQKYASDDVGWTMEHLTEMMRRSHGQH